MTPPDEEWLVRAIDVSSHQPRDLTAIIAEHRAEHVIVRLYIPGERPSPEHSVAQIESTRANNASIGGYCWCYLSFDPVATVRQALLLAELAGVKLPILWLDCETYNPTGNNVEDPGPNAAWLRAAIAECRRLGVRPGIYTALWWVQSYLSDDFGEFADIPTWLAKYNHIETLESVEPLPGSSRAMVYGHQFSADSVDLSVFRRKATEVA